MQEEQMHKLLLNVGLRSTKDRRRVLQYFQEDQAWTVAQLAEVLKDIPLSTIYRNVNKLLEHKLIDEVLIPGKEMYYEKHQTAHHDHAICEKCDRVFCVNCPLKEQQTSEDHYLLLKQLCPQCKQS